MTTGPDEAVRARLAQVRAAGWEIFERFDSEVRDRRFHPFVAADYDAVERALIELRTPGQRFLEWGSASGVITIMADLLGYEAYGIELDDSLVQIARGLAARFGSGARFVAGSFLPTGYSYATGADEDESNWIGTGPSGYLQLGRALEDFDVVFGYPWGGGEPMMLDLMRCYGRSDATLLMYGVNDGVRAYRGGALVRP